MKFIIKKKVEKPKPKKKFKIIKPKPAVKQSELTRVSGLTRAQANAMSPLELFGKLPSSLRGMVATPSKRGGGVKIARKSTPALMAEWKKFGKFPYPEGIMKRIGKTFSRLPNLKGQMTERAKYAIGQRISPSYKELTPEEIPIDCFLKPTKLSKKMKGNEKVSSSSCSTSILLAISASSKTLPAKTR